MIQAQRDMKVQKYRAMALPALSLRLSRLPRDVTIQDIWQWFSSKGSISWIEIFPRQKNFNQHIEGKITFEPAPAIDFWQQGHLVVTTNTNHCVRILLHQYNSKSRVNKSMLRSYPSSVTLYPSCLQFGSLLASHEMAVINSIEAQRSEDLSLQLESHSGLLTVRFLLKSISHKQTTRHHAKFSIPITSANVVYESISDTNSPPAIIISFPHPPQYFLQEQAAADSDSSLKEDYFWNSWIRVTDLSPGTSGPNQSPLSTYHSSIVDTESIDIGRLTTFRLVLRQSDDLAEYMDFKLILGDMNVLVEKRDDTKLHLRKESMWDFLDDQMHANRSNSFHLLQPILMNHVTLDFQVRYLLEVCVSRRHLNEYAVGHRFLDTLASTPITEACERLEHLVNKNIVLETPLDLFLSTFLSNGSLSAKTPYHCTLVNKVHVTPTGLRLNPPTVESSNRILRKYSLFADRFIRVQFLEETETERVGRGKGCNRNIWNRMQRVLDKGIRIGDRTFEFLVFGTSSIKEASATFFCPTATVSCDDIRLWMGDFSHIRNIAKYGARLGQCFSTSREIRGIPAPIIKYIPDIEKDDGECFTDRVGKISPFLARCIVEDMGLDELSEPSTFQIRMGGCKGVLAISPDAKKTEVHIRKSQEKFKANFNHLEVVRCSRFCTATLNRQTISILECLGVPRASFTSLLEEHIQLYEEAVKNYHAAIKLLTTFVDENQSCLIVAEMLNAGFLKGTENEPFVSNLLLLWRSWNLKLLKEKSRIHIEKSAFVLGTVDETGTLRGHYRSSEGSNSKDGSKLPQIFLQMTRPGGIDDGDTALLRVARKAKKNPSLHPGDIKVVEAVDNPKLHHLNDTVVPPTTSGDIPVPSMASGGGDLDGDTAILRGVCIVGRNPSLHPGDIRVVEAVDNPNLHHLKDTVVFPSTGDIPVPSMLSGGDLDGDDYFVIWDKRLLPPEWNHPPMKYSTPATTELDRDVTQEDIKEFFVQFMKNDNLGLIAHSHLAVADIEPLGPKSAKCLQLAELHSAAVDYQKTGVPANLKPYMIPREWPHFMGKGRSYQSRKALGAIYDKVKGTQTAFLPEQSNLFNKIILESFQLSQDIISQAQQVKEQYDLCIRRLMAQRRVETEFELFTGWVMTKPAIGSDYKRQEDIGRDFAALKQQFRDICQEQAGGSDDEHLDPFVAAMYQATLNQIQSGESSLMSFPWIFHSTMARLAAGENYKPLNCTIRAARRQ